MLGLVAAEALLDVVHIGLGGLLLCIERGDLFADALLEMCSVAKHCRLDYYINYENLLYLRFFIDYCRYALILNFRLYFLDVARFFRTRLFQFHYGIFTLLSLARPYLIVPLEPVHAANRRLIDLILARLQLRPETVEVEPTNPRNFIHFLLF